MVLRICIECKKEKDLETEFLKYSRSAFRWQCKSCYRAVQNRNHRELVKRRRIHTSEICGRLVRKAKNGAERGACIRASFHCGPCTNGTCCGCGVLITRENSPINNAYATGLNNRCSVCCHSYVYLPVAEKRKLKSREWYASHPNEAKAGGRKRKLARYRLSPEDYAEKVKSQNHRCLICDRTVSEAGPYRLSVDHDHSCCPREKSCGKCVRGLICNACNRGLGYFNDSAQRLSAASNYIKFWKSDLQRRNKMEKELKSAPPRIPTAENPNPTGAQLDGWCSSDDPNEGLFADANDGGRNTPIFTDTDLV